VVWIGLHEPGMALLQSVQRQFHLHDLAIEDANNAHQRPKIEQYGDALFIVARTAQLIDGVIAFGETHLFVGEGYLVSVRHGASTSYASVRERCESCPRSLARGEDYILYAILDFIVDNYSPVLDAIREEVESIEDYVLAHTITRKQIERLYMLRRDLLRLRNAIGPLVEVCRRLEHDSLAMVRTTMPLFRDVTDHVRTIQEQIDRCAKCWHSHSRPACWSGNRRKPRSRRSWRPGWPSLPSRAHSQALRHELQVPAGADMGVRPHRTLRCDARRLRGAVYQVQTFRLAVETRLA
jgi:Mg2+ and Co2+ transporter CorA